MESKEDLTQRIPPEFWQIPILKWLIQTEERVNAIEELKLPEDDRQEAILLAYYQSLQDWQQEHRGRDLTDEEFTWWTWYGSTRGILPHNWGIKLMCESIDKDYAQFTRNIEKMKKDGVIPENLSVPEFAALLLDPPDGNIGQIPPGHNFWYSLGVNDAGEWHAKDGLTRLMTIIKKINAAGRSYLRLLISKEARRGAGDKIEYVPDYSGIDPVIYNEIEFLDDNDRLSLFCELTGIDSSTLTDNESARILDILKALDAGYEFASKQGVSMAAYYGEDRKEAEKKARQRLFKKIKSSSDKIT